MCKTRLYFSQNFHLNMTSFLVSQPNCTPYFCPKHILLLTAFIALSVTHQKKMSDQAAAPCAQISLCIPGIPAVERNSATVDKTVNFIPPTHNRGKGETETQEEQQRGSF